MLTKTRLLIDKASIGITLVPEERPNIVMDDPQLADFTPDTIVWWYWDADALRAGRRTFLGIEVSNINALKESDFVAIERLGLPQVDCSEIGMADTSISAVLRWARRKYISSPDAFDQNRRALGTGTNRFATQNTPGNGR